MVEIHNQTTGSQTVDSTPLPGAEDGLTAMATSAIPPGLSLVTLRAQFEP